MCLQASSGQGISSSPVAPPQGRSHQAANSPQGQRVGQGGCEMEAVASSLPSFRRDLPSLCCVLWLGSESWVQPTLWGRGFHKGGGGLCWGPSYRLTTTPGKRTLLCSTGNRTSSIMTFFLVLHPLPTPLSPLPPVYGGSQARGQIRAIATSLYHSHSNVGSKPPLRPTPEAQCRIFNPLKEARDQTQVLRDASCVPFCCATTGTPH